MSKAKLVITAVVLEGRSQTEVAVAYGVSKGWVSRLVARYRVEGEAAFEPRPHRSLPHRATPAALFETMPKALPGNSRDADTHDRVRHDRIDKTGAVTLRVNGKMHHIGVGRTHAQTHVILLIQDLHVRIVNAITGELLRELTIDPERDYQPRNETT